MTNIYCKKCNLTIFLINSDNNIYVRIIFHDLFNSRIQKNTYTLVDDYGNKKTRYFKFDDTDIIKNCDYHKQFKLLIKNTIIFSLKHRYV